MNDKPTLWQPRHLTVTMIRLERRVKGLPFAGLRTRIAERRM